MADDLGYNDLGYFNNHKTFTPNINEQLENGIFLDAFHTFKICSPSRASTMTGRYPFNAGFYDMSRDTAHCTTNYTLLPELMKGLGYSTHAIGKWDIGFAKKECSPTYRGFDTFLGYYTACITDYWYHWSPTSNDKCGYGRDFSHNKDTAIQGADMNGTYNRVAFTEEAVRIIDTLPEDQPLYLYLAYQNVHLGCGMGRDLGINVPCETIDSYYSNAVNDTWKAQSALITELDYGVGNVTAALKRAGLWNDTVVIFTSDNGGPLDHCTNYPYRGGKHTFWEGGVRVVSYISGGAVPEERRGTKFEGLLHSSDWYRTVFEGIAGGSLPNHTGYMPPDGVNAWQAIMTNGTSPRTEVVHQVWNSMFNESVSAMRQGDFKLIRGDPGRQDFILAFPEPGSEPTAFGQSGGVHEAGTDHCRAPPGSIPQTDKRCEPYCLFNLVDDPAEEHDLSGDPQYAEVIARMSTRLDELGNNAPEPAFIIPSNEMAKFNNATCKQMRNIGYLEPEDLST
eukprot:TRINITY_DN12435_c0_g2_i1.p2 TRINITY_DN12435_c0_g2~~TRINITY_DN12435_c0_g2_i1.p2  ORF type:complete len:543 (+),score=100.69 TRINITY_DN12435_c0_g2_i1:106-1629(+)